jgi:fructose transport system permease protein
VTATPEAPEAPARPATRRSVNVSDLVLRYPALGPTCALILALVIFSLITSTFLSLDNMSLVVEQSLVVGTLALGQTLIILTAGIDLANAAIMVFGTLVMAKLAGGIGGVGGLVLGVLLCTALGAVSGGLVTGLRLPPFIVTLGLLTVVAASARIYAAGQSFPVTNGLLGLLGQRFYLFGQVELTLGMLLGLVMFGLAWYALTRTAWGRHVYALGGDPEAARLTGIHVNRTLLSVYVVAGVIYGIAAWQSLGRIPNADPNAFQTGNLDSITAVVIGGTSLFGGRGGVVGTLVGALIVTVLRSGLTQAGIDELYQDVATGILVIVAVALDQLARRRAR